MNRLQLWWATATGFAVLAVFLTVLIHNAVEVRDFSSRWTRKALLLALATGPLFVMDYFITPRFRGGASPSEPPLVAGVLPLSAVLITSVYMRSRGPGGDSQ